MATKHCLFLVCLIVLLALPLICGHVQHQCVHDKMRSSVQRASLVSAVQVKVLDSNASVTTYAATTAYTSIRIAAFFDDLEDSSKYCTRVGQVVSLFSATACTADDILTAEKKNMLKTSVVPNAIQRHAERLMIQSAGKTVIEAPLSTSSCAHYSIPASHYTTGYDADFLLYVSGGPTEGTTVAWAAACRTGPDGRPLYGVTNISPRFIDDTDYTVNVLTHEIAHALGFSVDFYRFDTINNLRGKSNEAYILKSPAVVAKAREQYGCATQSFMELEDTSPSHWKLRSAKDELMCGMVDRGLYTALTLAAFEDLGFYKARYGMAEKMVWGSGAGCGLTNNKCVANGASLIPKMFCTDASAPATANRKCTSDRLSLGYCDLSTSCAAVPSEYQYFAANSNCGTFAWMDYCPFYKPYGWTGCTSGSSSVLPGSYITPSSRCLDSSTSTIQTTSKEAVGALCAAIQCNGSPSYSIRLSASDAWISCPEGAVIDIGSQSPIVSGKVTCPYYYEVCSDYFTSSEATTTPTHTTKVPATSAPPSTSTTTSTRVPITTSTSAQPSTTTSTRVPITTSAATSTTPRPSRCDSLTNAGPECDSSFAAQIIVLPFFIFSFFSFISFAF